MKTLKKFEAITDLICKILTAVSAIALGLLTIDVFAQVCMRYIFQTPIALSTELTQIFFPWTVCLAMIPIARNNENTALVLFYDKFTGIGKHIVFLFVNAVMLWFSVLMCISSYRLCTSLVTEILPLTRMSKALNYGSMFVGFVGVCVMIAFNVVEYILLNMVKISDDETKGEVK